jgi:hypothetical protein
VKLALINKTKNPVEKQGFFVALNQKRKYKLPNGELLYGNRNGIAF